MILLLVFLSEMENMQEEIRIWVLVISEKLEQMSQWLKIGPLQQDDLNKKIISNLCIF